MSHIQSKPANKEYRDGWMRTFGRPDCSHKVIRRVTDEYGHENRWFCTDCGYEFTEAQVRLRRALWPR